MKDIVKPITDRRSWNDPIPPTEPEDDQCLTPPSNHHWVDVNFNIAGEPLRIGVGQYRQNVNFTQAEHEGVMYSSQILLINDWNGNPASTYIESIYIVVERTVSVLEFARLVYNLINISPTSQEYIDIKNELINQGMILDQNDTYKLIVMYRYANDCSGICINPQTLPSTNFTVDVLGLPAEVLIYIEENGEFSFHSAFDDEFGLSLIDNVYYMLTTLNSNVKFTASKTYYIECNNEEIEFLINFTFKSSIVGINN